MTRYYRWLVFIFILFSYAFLTQAEERSIEVDPYRTVKVVGPIGTGTLESLSNLHKLRTNDIRKPIFIYISSPGGEVYIGTRFILEMLSSVAPITTICVHECSSMAALIFLMGNTRIVTPGTQIMLHQARGQWTGRFDDVSAEIAQDVTGYNNLLFIVASRWGLSLPELKALFAKGDYYITAEEALKKGYIDGVIK